MSAPNRRDRRHADSVEALIERAAETRTAPAAPQRSPQPQHTPSTEELLTFEEANPGRTGHKEERIRAQFGGLHPARYYQLLEALIDTREALEHNPALAARLRRIRDANVDRRARRSQIRSTTTTTERNHHR